MKALRYAGTHTADGRGYSYNKVFDVDVPVGANTELSYRIFPTSPTATSLPEHLRVASTSPSPTAPT